MSVRKDKPGWESLDSFFSYLNSQRLRYVVLRNHEELLEAEFLKNHPDIDFLCESSEAFVRLARAVPSGKRNEKVHFRIKIGNGIVPIDVREVGDDYYDAAWETDMLETRILYRDFCYIPDPENYYYSLCYHALLQKHFLSDEYRDKLGRLKPEMKNRTEEEHLNFLETFMQNKNYFYCYPADRGVIFRFRAIDENRIKKNTKEEFFRKRKDFSRRLRRFLKSMFFARKEL